MNQIFAALYQSKQFLKCYLRDGKIFCQRAGGPPIVIEVNSRQMYCLFVDNRLVGGSENPKWIIGKLLRTLSK